MLTYVCVAAHITWLLIFLNRIAAAAAAEVQRASGAAAADRLARQLQLEGQLQQMQVWQRHPCGAPRAGR